jgi:hypothetical protein
MSELVPFRRWHLLKLLEEPMNKSMAPHFSHSDIERMEKIGSVSFIYKGELMVSGGISPYWAGRGQLWAMFSEKSKHHFVPTYRVIRRWLKEEIGTRYQRIELSVGCQFLVGKRRAEMLGFHLEVERARRYLPSGEDCALYSMVRE